MSDSRRIVCVSTELEGALLRTHAEVLITGVGAVNAAWSLTRRLAAGGVSQVILCGIGGAYPQSGLRIGDVVCAETETYGDLGADSSEGFLDMRALGLPLAPGIFNELPLSLFPAQKRARFVTVNTCTGRDSAAAAMVARTGGAVENMEGAAIAHVAALSGIEVGEIRGISNLAGNRDRAAWKVREAAQAAQLALLEWLNRQP